MEMVQDNLEKLINNLKIHLTTNYCTNHGQIDVEEYIQFIR